MVRRRETPSSRVEVGRVLLTVADVDRSVAFYGGVLDFEVTARAGQVTFLSAGGDYHQIALRVREGDVAAAQEKTRGAGGFALRYPDRRALSQVLRRLTQAGVPLDGASDLGLVEALYVRDPDGHLVELYYERLPADWPRGADGALRAGAEPLDLVSLRTAADDDDEENEPDELQPAPHQNRPSGLSDTTRTRLRDLRMRLLNLHKVLLDDAKVAYELDRGQVGSSASLLQLVINDPWFEWLHPLSELVVRIDETLEPDAPVGEAEGLILIEQVGHLLSPGTRGGRFAERYFEALQRQPAVIVAHAEVRRILKQTRL